MSKKIHYFLQLLILLTIVPLSFSIENPEKEISRIGLGTKLGNKVDLNLIFTNAEGKTKPLREFLDPNKPIILTPVYYECPRLCGLLLTGFTRLVNSLNLELGSEFQILTVSFNPQEGSELAAKRQAEYRKLLEKPESKPAYWQFFVGNKENVDPLMEQIGFRYFKDEDEYAHTAVIIILSPQGEISQYFTGIDFSPWDVKLALIEASQGKVGSRIDHILLYCFRYDHNVGKYTWAVFSLLRVGGLASILVLLAVIYWASHKRHV